jgi:hypothetical protein
MDPFEELRLLKSRLARIEAAANGIDDDTRTWSTRDIENRDTWNANRDSILKASREGRIVESEPIERPAPIVYPPESEFPGLRQTGPSMYEAIVKPKEQP